MSNTRNKKTFIVTITAVMTAIASVIYMVFPEINIVPGVSYMKIDFSDFPALLTGVVFGPIQGVLVEVVKNIIHLAKTTTFGIGELMNILLGSTMVVSLSLFMRLFSKLFSQSKFSAKTYILSAVITVALSIVMGWLSNMALTPVFYKLMGIPMASETYWAGVWGSTALNAVKSAFNVLPFYPVYLSVEKIVKKYAI